MDFKALARSRELSIASAGRSMLCVMADTAIETAYAEFRTALARRRRVLAEEIARHPRPITGCDVHFNRLLEERAALSEELDRFDAFIAASTLLTAQAKDRIRASEETWSVPDLRL